MARKSLNSNKLEEECSYPRITKKSLHDLCKQLSLYSTPYLNTCLYLQYKGFVKIENLEEYTGLTALWLNNNGIRVIENLNHLIKLKCLQLQNNFITTIEGLHCLTNICTLNLSYNRIKRIENLSCLPRLSTLQISHNCIQDDSDIIHLVDCTEISVLDISGNSLHDPKVVEIFSKMKNLRVLNLVGNPVTRNIPNYRKVVLLNTPNLTYLDNRPVWPRERSCVAAWGKGGAEAERVERLRWDSEEKRKMENSVKAVFKPQLKDINSEMEEILQNSDRKISVDDVNEVEL